MADAVTVMDNSLFISIISPPQVPWRLRWGFRLLIYEHCCVCSLYGLFQSTVRIWQSRQAVHFQHTNDDYSVCPPANKKNKPNVSKASNLAVTPTYRNLEHMLIDTGTLSFNARRWARFLVFNPINLILFADVIISWSLESPAGNEIIFCVMSKQARFKGKKCNANQLPGMYYDPRLP